MRSSAGRLSRRPSLLQRARSRWTRRVRGVSPAANGVIAPNAKLASISRLTGSDPALMYVTFDVSAGQPARKTSLWIARWPSSVLKAVEIVVSPSASTTR